MTPTDDYAFVGEPPMLRPRVNEVHIDCTFTWDIPLANHLFWAWAQYYPKVKIGGVAICPDESRFIPGMYVRSGITFTSRGCNNHCPWCLVPEREGRLRELPIVPGKVIQDNNLLQCSRSHLDKVFEMLRKQHGIVFSGGLDARLFTHYVVDELRSCRIKEIFVACDTKQGISAVAHVAKWLDLPRQKLRCYVLIGFDQSESLTDAEERLKEIYKVGYLPFVQLYQPPDRYIKYPKEWRDLARTWSRPAAMKALMSGPVNLN